MCVNTDRAFFDAESPHFNLMLLYDIDEAFSEGGWGGSSLVKNWMGWLNNPVPTLLIAWIRNLKGGKEVGKLVK